MRYITPFLLALILLGAGCSGVVETDATAQVATPPEPEPESEIIVPEPPEPSQAAVEVISKEEYERRLKAGEL